MTRIKDDKCCANCLYLPAYEPCFKCHMCKEYSSWQLNKDFDEKNIPKREKQMDNLYRFRVDNEGTAGYFLDADGHIVVAYNKPGSKQGYDFKNDGSGVAREMDRRCNLYNREHLDKLQNMQIESRKIRKNDILLH